MKKLLIVLIAAVVLTPVAGLGAEPPAKARGPPRSPQKRQGGFKRIRCRQIQARAARRFVLQYRGKGGYHRRLRAGPRKAGAVRCPLAVQGRPRLRFGLAAPGPPGSDHGGTGKPDHHPRRNRRQHSRRIDQPGGRAVHDRGTEQPPAAPLRCQRVASPPSASRT